MNTDKMEMRGSATWNESKKAWNVSLEWGTESANGERGPRLNGNPICGNYWVATGDEGVFIRAMEAFMGLESDLAADEWVEEISFINS